MRLFNAVALVNQLGTEKHSGNAIITAGADPAYAVVAMIRPAL